MASTRGHNDHSYSHIENNITTGKLFLIFLVILSVNTIKQCQSSSSSSSLDSSKKVANSSDASSVAATTLLDQATNSSSENITVVDNNPKNVETLLSASEFVDFTEAPTLLFDGTSNDNENDTESSPTPTQTTTTISPIVSVTTLKVDESNNTSDITTTTTVASNIENDDSSEDATGESEGEAGEQPTTAKEPFELPKNVSQYMDYIETLFHDLRHQLSDLFEPHLPQLIRSSQMVQLSGSCSYDMLRMALALRQFEPWALRMIDSSGKVPEGIFEGSFTALGSYDECLNTVFGQQETSSTTTTTTKSSEDNNHHNQTQGKYCLVNVSPYLPPKPPADRVERMFQDEANRRNYTKDNQFSRLSPMFYYMKFRIGICIPSSCTESDMDSLSEALSTSLRLNITIPNCRIRQYHPLTNHQLAGGLVFATVLALVFGATLMDYSRRKFDQQKRQVFMSVVAANSHHHRQLPENKVAKTQHEQQDDHQSNTNNKEIIRDDDDDDGDSIEGFSRSKFNERLSKNWSWLSFSLITNYKLHFSSSSLSQASKKQTIRINSRYHDDNIGNEQIMIKCLNGIRVISLCWVIVANSYITLDPRATKRLTKTREAPKDFLFQMVAQASLAIETFFFLSGILMSLSFIRKFQPEVGSVQANKSLGKKQKQQQQQEEQREKDQSFSHTKWRWLQFYIHRYIRMTPATMLVIAFTMYAYGYGDGPLWFEATHKAHQSCSENWWRHLLHIANFIDTRQMCFIHYWYIAADMQLFLFAPLLLFILYKYRRIGYTIVMLIGATSIGSIFYTTYVRNLPPTLLFYNSDPESRREFGNTIMTKPLTHALPYLVGMLVGKWLSSSSTSTMIGKSSGQQQQQQQQQSLNSPSSRSLTTLFGGIATVVALAEVFLPYKWNNSHLPTRLLASLYAAFFRFAWSLVLAYIIMSCRHKRGKRCSSMAAAGGTVNDQHWKRRSFTTLSSESSESSSLSSSPLVKMAPSSSSSSSTKCASCQSLDNIIDGSQTTLIGAKGTAIAANGAADSRYDDNIIMSSTSSLSSSLATSSSLYNNQQTCKLPSSSSATAIKQTTAHYHHNRVINDNVVEWCLCGNGGNLVNRLLSFDVFTYLSKLSFVAYLIHLPLMSVFIAQTRGLFAFSHTLVIHLALSYLVMTFVLSFILVHLIELPFLTFERYLFEKFLKQQQHSSSSSSSSSYPTINHHHHHHHGKGRFSNNQGNNIMNDTNNCAGIHIVEPSKSFHNQNEKGNKQKNRYSNNHQGGNYSSGQIMISVSEKL